MSHPNVGYLKYGALLIDKRKAKKKVRKAAHFTFMDGQLYQKGLSQLLLKCSGPAQVDYILEEINERSCGQHLEAKSLALKVLRLAKDTFEFIK